MNVSYWVCKGLMHKSAIIKTNVIEAGIYNKICNVECQVLGYKG